ncbi:OsmC family protein [Jeotgalibacillus campisalis]|uniref:Putative peroxiredoxin-related protein n=1 Tax=Jeotgalibacillus campisalis TaxID=220754 RepID=A0A0C2VU24_9BACL|nr:OsmC family protein [Jeotgalibacillus campisalis]KIL47483.1 putative peroxiredoxin-related protein [Jeotgalibacillus campisalis]
MTLHTFILNAKWPGGRNSVGTIETKNLQTNISIPEDMDGPGVGTNPDEMLLGAASTCYIITLAAMLERANVDVEELSLQSEGQVEVLNGVFTYKTITHRPYIKMKNPEDLKKVERLAFKADESCMISRAVQGNISLKVIPTIL